MGTGTKKRHKECDPSDLLKHNMYVHLSMSNALTLQKISGMSIVNCTDVVAVNQTSRGVMEVKEKILSPRHFTSNTGNTTILYFGTGGKLPLR